MHKRVGSEVLFVIKYNSGFFSSLYTAAIKFSKEHLITDGKSLWRFFLWAFNTSLERSTMWDGFLVWREEKTKTFNVIA